MILRDHLAADRTRLANERTLLAYLRTSLAFAIAGASIIRFLQGFFLHSVGWAFIVVSAATCLLGILRFRRMKKIIEERPTACEGIETHE
jgi:putative membrane protein